MKKFALLSVTSLLLVISLTACSEEKTPEIEPITKQSQDVGINIKVGQAKSTQDIGVNIKVNGTK